MSVVPKGCREDAGWGQFVVNTAMFVTGSVTKEPDVYKRQIFYLPEYGCTSAELSDKEKNKISHRGKALRAIKDELK